MNRHVYCESYKTCNPKIAFVDYMCTDASYTIFNREDCYTITDYNQDCVKCASRGGLFCLDNDKCYLRSIKREIDDGGKFCSRQYITSYVLCGEEDGSNGCQSKKKKHIDDVWLDE